MKTDVLTPQAVFYLPQHLVVPLFQRPYVWEETDQWLPLWQDVSRLVDLRFRDPYSTTTHFLGAVVLRGEIHRRSAGQRATKASPVGNNGMTTYWAAPNRRSRIGVGNAGSRAWRSSSTT